MKRQKGRMVRGPQVAGGKRSRACMSPEELKDLRAREARLKRLQRARETDEEKALRRSRIVRRARERRASLDPGRAFQEMDMHHFMVLEERTDLCDSNEQDPLALSTEWVKPEKDEDYCSVIGNACQQPEDQVAAMKVKQENDEDNCSVIGNACHQPEDQVAAMKVAGGKRSRACMSPEELKDLRAREARLKRLQRARETDEEKALRRSRVARRARERRASLDPGRAFQETDMHHFVKQEKDEDCCSVTGNSCQQPEDKVSAASQTTDKTWPKAKKRVLNAVHKCNICRKNLSSKGHLRLHKIRTHAMFSCKICGRSVSHRKELLQHCDSVHRRVVDGMFECSACQKLIREYRSFVAHLKLRGRCKVRITPQLYVCDECGKMFKRSYGLRNHQMSVHLPDAGQSTAESLQQAREKKYTCPTCGRRFRFRCLLQDHLNLHSGAKPYRCQECGRTFAQRSSMKQHERTHGSTKPFKCPHCGVAFFMRGNMNKHVRTHTGERPFVCDVCGETYAQSNHLTVHRRTHTGERPFSCDVCGRGFTKKSDVLRHVRIHTGELPFLCQVCGRGFRQSAQCANHVKSRHPETVAVE
ncbi:zinc finger protein 660-like isoform X3 [Bacillus rossius redtenbacheri]|uniref:zinc finger protein 660-like isoform X3 n=1 Tax=Bacillus rossius redtenbacheri TaxID=93214 RepID=UPI002FDD6605